jgi:phage baseplate assembly protein W
LAEQYKGISFPFRIGVKGGFVLSKADINDFTHIDESIEQILGTREGERTMEKYIYSDIDTSIFEPNDDNLAGLIDFQVREALERLETRIELDTVDIFMGKGGEIYAFLSYSVPEFNNQSHDLKVRVGDLSVY